MHHDKSSETQKSEIANENNNDDRTCVVCLEVIKNVVFLPCKHLCTCSKCALTILKSSNACPICRTKIQSHLEVFI